LKRGLGEGEKGRDGDIDIFVIFEILAAKF